MMVVAKEEREEERTRANLLEPLKSELGCGSTPQISAC